MILIFSKVSLVISIFFKILLAISISIFSQLFLAISISIFSETFFKWYWYRYFSNFNKSLFYVPKILINIDIFWCVSYRHWYLYIFNSVICRYICLSICLIDIANTPSACLESVFDRYKCMSDDLLTKLEINIFNKMQGVGYIFFTTRHLRRKKGREMHPPPPKTSLLNFFTYLLFNLLTSMFPFPV